MYLGEKSGLRVCYLEVRTAAHIKW